MHSRKLDYSSSHKDTSGYFICIWLDANFELNVSNDASEDKDNANIEKNAY